MGGKAFKTELPNARFPRLSPETYKALKEKTTALLRELYEHVDTPREAPGKVDYGDIDFVVFQPRRSFPDGEVQHVLGAGAFIVGNGLNNYAIQLDNSTSDNDYYQVDVQVCATYEEYEQSVFWCSYGDMGMILGLMAATVKLSLGRRGLKLAKPLETSPPMTFQLSSSKPKILQFFGLSEDAWKAGFTTRTEVYDWIASSRFFDAKKLLRFASNPTGKTKVKEERTMYQTFVRTYLTEYTGPSRAVDPEAVVNEALDFFAKRALRDAVLHAADVKKTVGQWFSGKRVEEWTGKKGLAVKFIMAEVRARLGGEDLLPRICDVDLDSLPSDAIERMHLTLRVWEEVFATMLEKEAAEEMKEDKVKTLVLNVKEDLCTPGSNGTVKIDGLFQAEKARKEEKKAKKAEEEAQGNVEPTIAPVAVQA